MDHMVEQEHYESMTLLASYHEIMGEQYNMCLNSNDDMC